MIHVRPSYLVIPILLLIYLGFNYNKLKKIVIPYVFFSLSMLIFYFVKISSENLFVTFLVIFTILIELCIIAVNKGKKGWVIPMIIVFISSAVFFINALPNYTYDTAISHIKKDLAGKYNDVTACDPPQSLNIFSNREAGKYLIFKYDYYLISFNIDNEVKSFWFEPYTGAYQEVLYK